MVDARCPHCGEPVELCDTMDANPPIPYMGWPDRWGVNRDEQGVWYGEWECSRCGEWTDPADMAATAGQPRDYPSWLAEPRNAMRARRRAAAAAQNRG